MTARASTVRYNLNVKYTFGAVALNGSTYASSSGGPSLNPEIGCSERILRSLLQSFQTNTVVVYFLLHSF
jgi:hypothetical protein